MSGSDPERVSKRLRGMPLQEVGGFELLSKLGQGAMGAVFKARQKSMDRIVAVKILPRSIAKDAQFIERFQREARATAKLNHPNIVQGIDAGQDGATGFWYYAMEFVDGPSLASLLKDQTFLTEEKALEIVQQIAQALECVQQHQMVHRDIKPDNILLTSEGDSKLADLGLARQTNDDASLTQSGNALGTPAYMAPEQIRGELHNLDIRTDLYALGATLFHLVTGRTPFSGETGPVIMTKHLMEPPPSARQINPVVSEATSRMIQRLMQKKKEQRFQTPSELAEHIGEILSGTVKLKDPPNRERGTAEKKAPASQRKTGGNLRSGLAVSRYVGAGMAAIILIAIVWKFGVANKTLNQPLPAISPAINVAQKVDAHVSQPVDHSGTKIAAAFSEAQAFEKSHPNDFSAAQKKYDALIALVKGTPAENEFTAKIKDAIGHVQEHWYKAADDVWQALEEKATTLAASNDYDSALSLLAELPPAHQTMLSAKAAAEVAALREEAEQKIKQSIQAAEELSKKGELQKALDEATRAEAIKYSRLNEPLAALKKRLQTELNAMDEQANVRLAIQKKFDIRLERFDAALIERNNIEEAKDEAIAAQRDTELKPQCEAQANALLELVKAFEDIQNQEAMALKALEGKTVTLEKDKGVVKKAEAGVITLMLAVEPGINQIMAQKAVKVADLTNEQRDSIFRDVKPPDTPGGRVAAVILKLRHGSADLGTADEVLNGIPDFPLAPHFKKLVAIKRYGVVEEAARSDWIDLERAATPPCASAQAGKLLLAKLAEWQEKHGKTKFASSKNNELAEWKNKAQQAQGLFAHWRLDEKSATTARDSSGNNRHGTLKGGVTWVDDGKHKGLSFDGISGYVDFNTPFPDLTIPFSLSLWIKPAEKQPTLAGIFGNYGQKGESCVGIGFHQNGDKLNMFSFGYGAGTKWSGVINDIQFAPNVWQHVVCVCNGAESIIYLNGDEKGRSPATAPIAPNAILNARLGEDYAEGRFFRGSMSNVSVYSRALTPDEITALGKEASEPAIAVNEGPAAHEKPVAQLEMSTPLPVTATAETKLPVPTPAAQAQAEKKVNAFKEESQKKGIDLSLKLLKLSAEYKNDAPMYFAVLREARDTALSAGDLDMAFSAIDSMVSAFAVDEFELKSAAVATVTRGATVPKYAEKALGSGIDFIERLSRESQFDNALKFIAALDDLARRTNNADMERTIQLRAKDIRAQQTEWQKVKPSMDVLEKNPNDPDAALAAGRYFAASRNDWDHALHLLAKCAQPALKDAATKDLLKPDEAPARADVGDLWWSLSEKESGLFKTALQNRAVNWYTLAVEGMDGARKAQIEKRIQITNPADAAAASTGLVFWVEPSSSPADSFQDLASGSKAINYGVKSSDVGHSRSLSFALQTFIHYEVPPLVQSVGKNGSVFAWVKRERSAATWTAVVCRGFKDKNTDINDFSLMIGSEHMSAFFNWPVAKAFTGSSKSPVPVAKWAHIGMVWDEKRITFYLNGKPDGSTALPYGTPLKRSTRVTIGADLPGEPEYFAGQMGSVMIFNRTLTETDVQRLHASTMSKFH